MKREMKETKTEQYKVKFKHRKDNNDEPKGQKGKTKKIEHLRHNIWKVKIAAKNSTKKNDKKRQPNATGK